MKKFYKVKKTIVDKNILNINELINESNHQIIPNKKQKRFEKDSYTILQIT